LVALQIALPLQHLVPTQTLPPHWPNKPAHFSPAGVADGVGAGVGAGMGAVVGAGVGGGVDAGMGVVVVTFVGAAVGAGVPNNPKGLRNPGKDSGLPLVESSVDWLVDCVVDSSLVDTGLGLPLVESNVAWLVDCVVDSALLDTRL